VRVTASWLHFQEVCLKGCVLVANLNLRLVFLRVRALHVHTCTHSLTRSLSAAIADGTRTNQSVTLYQWALAAGTTERLFAPWQPLTPAIEFASPGITWNST
jgi:hypothetical protein